jgi:hypothetical protein
MVIVNAICNNEGYIISQTSIYIKRGSCAYKIAVKDTETGKITLDAVFKFENKNVLGLYVYKDYYRVCTICEKGLFLLDCDIDCTIINDEDIPKSLTCIETTLLPLTDLYAEGDDEDLNNHKLIFVTDLILSTFLMLDNKYLLDRIATDNQFCLYSRHSHSNYLITLNKTTLNKIIKFKVMYQDSTVIETLQEIGKMSILV